MTAARSGEDIGSVLGSEYRAARGAAKGRVADAYTRAFDPGALAEAGVPAAVPVETVQGLNNAVRFAVDDPARGVMVPMAETTPNTVRAINVIRDFSQDGSLPRAFPHLTTAPEGATAVGWQQIDLARKVLKGLQNAAQANPADKAGMARVVDAFDTHVGKSDPLLNQARQMHSERMGLYEPQRTNATSGANTVLRALGNNAEAGQGG